MAVHARNNGADHDEILEEDASRTTEENLRNSARLLAGRGARTARYYRPTAVLREYVAIMRDNLWINVVGLSLSILPLIASVLITFG